MKPIYHFEQDINICMLFRVLPGRRMVVKRHLEYGK